MVFESLALNKPVLLTGDNGIRNILGDSVLYLDSFDINDMVDKILFMAYEGNYIKYKNKITSLNPHRSYQDIAIDFERLLV